MSTEVITLNVFTLHTVNNPSWKYLTVANSCHVSKMNKMYQQISVHIGDIYMTHALWNIAKALHLFCVFHGDKDK